MAPELGGVVASRSVAQPWRSWALAILGLLTVGVGCWLAVHHRPAIASAQQVPTGAELARLVQQLRARDSFYRRVICRWVSRNTPALARHFPKLFDPGAGDASRRRLEAHERLLALGSDARPALPLLAQAFCDDEPMVQTYTLVVVAHLRADEREFVARVRQTTHDFDRQLRHFCGVLRDEDERLRDFAWRCLEVAGPSARRVATSLEAIRDDAGAEAELRALAAQTLAVMSPTNLSSGSPGHP